MSVPLMEALRQDLLELQDQINRFVFPKTSLLKTLLTHRLPVEVINYLVDREVTPFMFKALLHKEYLGQDTLKHSLEGFILREEKYHCLLSDRVLTRARERLEAASFHVRAESWVNANGATDAGNVGVSPHLIS